MLPRFDSMIHVHDPAHQQRNGARCCRCLQGENRGRLRSTRVFATMARLGFHHARDCSLNTRQFLGLDEALAWLQRTVSPPDTSPDTIELTDALNRIVAHTVHSPMDVPPFAASSMDGYAVCTLDPVFSGSPPFTLALHGESRAGAPFGYEPSHEPRIDHAVRIFTGAVLPARCDAVVIQEDVERVDSGIVLSTIPRARANVRAPGNDIARGAVLADAGLRLSPFDLAWLTACGLTKIAVRRKIRLALFSTGDELRNAGETLQSGQIYDANRFALVQLMRDAPVDINDLGILPDDPSAIETTLRAASEYHDVDHDFRRRISR